VTISSPVDTRLPLSPQDLPPELQDFGQAVFNAIRNLQLNFATIISTVEVDPGTLTGDGSVVNPIQVISPYDPLVTDVFC
jgi:hypothetical protein